MSMFSMQASVVGARRHRRLEGVEVDDEEVDRRDAVARRAPPRGRAGRGRASRPACTIGCSVFTRPSSISGNSVSSLTSRTGSPASRSACGGAAGGEELDLARREAARRGATRPVLSETEISARRIGTRSGNMGGAPRARGGPRASGRGGRLGDAAEGPGDLAEILDHLAADNHLRRRQRRRGAPGRSRPSPRAPSAPPPARNIQTSPRGQREQRRSAAPRRARASPPGAGGSAPRRRAGRPGAARSNWLRARASATVRMSSPRSSCPRAST